MPSRKEALEQAAVCPKCGARMWPPEQLERHVALHELRRLRYKGELNIVQRIFNKMRFPGDKRPRRKKENP